MAERPVPRILIVGGGYVGMYTALRLQKRLKWSSVRITVKDAAGATVYSKELSGPGQAADTKTVSGAAGTWTMSASRQAGSYGGTWAPGAGSGFSGQYAANVSC